MTFRKSLLQSRRIQDTWLARPVPWRGLLLLVIAASVVVGVIWAVRHFRNERARAQILVAAETLKNNVAMDIEGIAEGKEAERPTPAQIHAMLGRGPDTPLVPRQDRAVEQYTFQGASRNFHPLHRLQTQEHRRRASVCQGQDLRRPVLLMVWSPAGSSVPIPTGRSRQ